MKGQWYLDSENRRNWVNLSRVDMITEAADGLYWIGNNKFTKKVVATILADAGEPPIPSKSKA